ncbi:Putative pterin-4-alpha-carbinolamine dehydratase [Hydrogenovibrio crunogenus]|uniref:4a-hydroxytetrahydrobiopterin dehydratase n=1 Tax=Hydrogenovibrio crunogenus TaxID=39765 RepID=A0A4P7NZ50_9GAMM|nr:4a-hydroxytetrahydrobiopterin dehydratase [Hydrogenovibrio crunogenus]QBZ82869.1 Putative pterin-4-alpha-carbinolamine dehydratase [Hydrogenovibrio crunogenus]RUM90674.1 MAG: 4a-hydroxytetrahydrobiopterin dehydratase [Thiomicrospira sp.]
MNERWKLKKKPASLEARFEFNDFEKLRAFLDELAEQADLLDHHPNISFGRGHASVIIYSNSEELTEIDYALAKGIDEGFHRVTAYLQGTES